MTAPVEILYLADCPEVLPALARWVCEEFGRFDPSKTVEGVERMLRERLNRDRLPLTLVAFIGPKPVGSASLQTLELPSHPQYAHWLGTVFVRRPHRNRGIGSRLVERAVQEAERLGVRELHLHTPDRESMYARLGWTVVERTRYRNQDVAIMRLELAGHGLAAPADEQPGERGTRADSEVA